MKIGQILGYDPDMGLQVSKIVERGNKPAKLVLKHPN